MQESIRSRFHYIEIVFLVFLVISALTRTALLAKSIDLIDLSVIELLKIYTIGAFYDFISAGYLVTPFVVYLLLIPQKFFNHKLHRYITYLFTYALLFGAVFLSFSEWFFWDEFSVRFNFIAVDYLIYTKEVIGNIKESYPMGTLFSVIAIISASLFYILYKTKRVDTLLRDNSTIKQRIKPTLVYLLIPVISFAYVTDSLSKFSTNQYSNELSKAGLYSLFGAFRNNTLDYNTFYLSQDEDSSLSNLKKSLSLDNSTFLNDGGVARNIINDGQEKDYNVIVIVVESLSGMFLESLGGDKGLTPNLDALVKESMFFDNFYATGTRTIRGMESITLSVPPMPGRSIVKKPDNHNMYSSGFIFRNKGYETKFIYGGYGYFDNMNEFFSNNGFDIVDRSNFSEEEDTFHTVWGVCDEDLLNKTLKEADSSYHAHKPFMSFVMTTSNHRPYDYPNGRVDIASHTGRDGAVKYTDYAIGDFLKKAKDKPWFKNTIFVVVADHCATSAGKVELPLDKYHIPMIVYAPEIIKPQIVNKLSSQIDIMPTLFNMLNWSYKSKFYGRDILEDSFEPRALVGTYQKLGLYKDDVLSILSVGKKLNSYKVLEQDIFSTKYKEISVDTNTQEEILKYYQSASYMQKKKLDRYED